MAKLLLVVIALCSGCFVLPATTATRRTIGTRESEIAYGKPTSVTLQASPADASIVVRTRSERACSRTIYKVIEVTERETARTSGPDDPRAAVFGALLAPVTVPVSALITGLAVLLDSPQTRHESELDHTTAFACTTVEPALPIALAFPSGRIVESVTNYAGTLVVAVPESEPYRGNVMISAKTGAVDRVYYTLPVPAVTRMRDAVLACAAAGRLTGALEVVLTTDASGLMTSFGLGHGDAPMSACIASAMAGVRFPVGQRARTLVLPLTLAER